MGASDVMVPLLHQSNGANDPYSGNIAYGPRDLCVVVLEGVFSMTTSFYSVLGGTCYALAGGDINLTIGAGNGSGDSFLSNISGVESWNQSTVKLKAVIDYLDDDGMGGYTEEEDIITHPDTHSLPSISGREHALVICYGGGAGQIASFAIDPETEWDSYQALVVNVSGSDGMTYNYGDGNLTLDDREMGYIGMSLAQWNSQTSSEPETSRPFLYVDGGNEAFAGVYPRPI